MQEQRSEMKANYSYLFDLAVALMSTNYTPDHVHTQTQPHANIHVAST
jgi:hypothetical protein